MATNRLSASKTTLSPNLEDEDLGSVRGEDEEVESVPPSRIARAGSIELRPAVNESIGAGAQAETIRTHWPENYETSIVRQYSRTRLVLHLEQIKMHLDDNGRAYQRDLAQGIQCAREYIDDRLKNRRLEEKYAIVLDIDETAISNWEYFETNWPYFSDEKFQRWANRGEDKLKACPIIPTLELFEYVKSRNVAIFFITLRDKKDRTRTMQILEKSGYRDWQELRMQSDSDPGYYKLDERRKILEAGYLIIANIGDQESDLSGGSAERQFKLPNPFYSCEVEEIVS